MPPHTQENIPSWNKVIFRFNLWHAPIASQPVRVSYRAVWRSSNANVFTLPSHLSIQYPAVITESPAGRCVSTLPGRTGEAQCIERVYNRILKSNGSYYTGAGVLVPEFHRGWSGDYASSPSELLQPRITVIFETPARRAVSLKDLPCVRRSVRINSCFCASATLPRYQPSAFALLIAYYHSQRPLNNITEVRLITFGWIAE